MNYAIILALALGGCKRGEKPGGEGQPDADDTAVTTDDTGSDEVVDSVFTQQMSALLQGQGDSRQLAAAALDADGNAIDAAVTWSTEDPDVSIDDNGVVTALSEVGSAQVFAEAGGVRSPPILVLIARPVEGCVVLEDEQLVSLTLPDDDSWGGGTPMDLVLDGVDLPEVGACMVGGENAPVMGLVTEAQAKGDHVRVVVETSPPEDVFQDLLLDEVFAASDLEHLTEDDLAAYAMDPPPPGWSDYCQTTSGFFSNVEVSGWTPSVDTSAIAFHARWTWGSGPDIGAQGTAKFTFTHTMKWTAGFEDKLTCDKMLYTIPIPIGTGPLAAWVGFFAELGIGLEAEGKLTAADLGVATTIVQEVDIDLGVDCTGASCEWRDTWEDKGLSATQTVDEADLLTDYRLELSASAYGYAKLNVGMVPYLAWVLRLNKTWIELLEAKAGAKDAVVLVPSVTQAMDTSLASTEQLTLFFTLSSPAIDTVNSWLGRWGAPSNPSLDLSVEFASNPKAASGTFFDVDPTGICDSDDSLITVTLDTSSLEWLGLDNVDTVTVYKLDPDVPSLEELHTWTPTSSSDASFVWTWEPDDTDKADPPLLVAFVQTSSWLGIDGLEHEIAVDTQIQTTCGCSTVSYDTDLAVATNEGIVSSLDTNTGSINDNGDLGFIASDGSDKTVWWMEYGGAPEEIGWDTSSSRTVGGGAISDNQTLVAKDKWTTFYYLRLWDTAGNNTIIGESPGDFDTSQLWVDINASDHAIMTGYTGGVSQTAVYLWDGSTLSEVKNWPGIGFVRPQLSDDDTIVWSDSAGVSVHAAGTETALSSGLTAVSDMPGISAVGNRVGFIGTYGVDEGLYLAWDGGSGWTTQAITRQTDGDFTDFEESTQRVGVSYDASTCGGMTTLVFKATDGEGVVGVWAAHVTDSTATSVSLDGLQPLLEVGDILDGECVVEGSATGDECSEDADCEPTDTGITDYECEGWVVADLDLFDPVSGDGHVVIKVTRDTGSKGLVRLMRE